MTRRQVTLPKKEFYDKVKGLKPEIKTPVINAILDLLFEEKQINYDELSDAVTVALACIVPDLRRVQSQFDNGKLSKNSQETAKGLFCPNENTQIQPTPPKFSQAGSSILNNNIYNNIYNTSINQSNQSVKNTTTDNNEKIEESNADKRQFYTEVLEEHLKTIEELEPQTHKRALNLVKQLGKQTSAFTIHNQQMMPEDILERYVDIFRTANTSEILSRLQNVFAGVDAAPSIKNKFRYTVSAMFSEASGL